MKGNKNNPTYTGILLFNSNIILGIIFLEKIN